MAHESVMGRNNYFFKTHIYLALGYHKHEYCRPADCNISDYLDTRWSVNQSATNYQHLAANYPPAEAARIPLRFHTLLLTLTVCNMPRCFHPDCSYNHVCKNG